MSRIRKETLAAVVARRNPETWPHITDEMDYRLSDVPETRGRSLVLIVQWSEGAAPVAYCGDSHCTGECGLPALVMQHNGRELKAQSSVAAHGPLMQPWSGTCGQRWSGKKEEVPVEHRETVLKRYWL